jgi:hypothetical protein
MNPLTQPKNAATLPVLIALTLGCLALAPQARAVCQEGCDLSNNNTFLGDNALINNTFGSANTAIGAAALLSNTFGNNNTATGLFALEFNSNGVKNVATGDFALQNNTFGNNNTATGSEALQSNTLGSENTAIGSGALFSNNGITSHANTAIGFNALLFNGSGTENTAIGHRALLDNTTGNSNIAVGASAGSALTTGKNNIDIGNVGVAGESAKIRIGNAAHRSTFIRGISGVTVPGGVGVIIDTDGHLGTTTSSARFKDAIKPMDKASEAILALKPVTFHYKHEIDPKGIPQFGLVAEDVEKVNPDLVARDQEGKPYTVRYEAVNAMLLNEFLKEHRTVQDQKATIAELKHNFAEQQRQIDALTEGLQKVSAQLELSKTAPQTVSNNHDIAGIPVLGNHRGQSEQSRLELGLCLSD